MDNVKLNEIIIVCNEIAELCKQNDETDWSRSFYRFAENLKHGDWDIEKRKIIGIYAGMGSFNDLVLQKRGHPFGKENDELKRLRHGLYQKVTDNW